MAGVHIPSVALGRLAHIFLFEKIITITIKLSNVKNNCQNGFRVESDLLGTKEVPECALYGVQTLRGMENFEISKFRLCDYPYLSRVLPLPSSARPWQTTKWVF